MPRDVARDALYNGRINLWVEDDLTRVYLGALWNDPAVKFLIGGGYNGVLAILKDAEHAGYTNVFGVVDGDHGRSNHADWFVPGRSFRRFVLPRHEIENYLLDTVALEGCRFNTHRRTASEIDMFLDNEAERRCWCVACRDAVALIRERIFDGFLEQPKSPPVDTEDAAKNHIIQSFWFRTLPRKSSRINETLVHRLLKWEYARALKRLGDDTWRIDFPGKQLLHLIGGRICNKSIAPQSYQPSSAEFDSDLAKSIAAWQVASGLVPNDLSDLLAALKARISP
jgi:hypothetical protein